MKKLGIAFAAALAIGAMLVPLDASAQRFGGGHGGGGGMHFGGARGGMHFGGPGGGPGRMHFGGYGGGPRHFGGGYFRGPGPRFRPYARFGRPAFRGPRFLGPPVRRWYGPRRVFVGGVYRPYPVLVRPRFGYGFAPGCTVRRSVGFLPNRWRKVVTVRTCIVP